MPASRTFFPLRILGVGRVVVEGRFFPQSTGPVVNSTNKGPGYTITRTGAGIYLITFADKYVDLMCFDGCAQAVTGTSWTVSFGTFTNPSTSAPQTLELFTRQGGGLLDMPIDPNNSVSFSITFSNSSVRF